LSERILFNELKPGQIIVVDCEGDPEDGDNSHLVFRSVDKPVPIGA
jgi:ATP-dependent Clp protease ATP-binding subunit ClpC